MRRSRSGSAMPNGIFRGGSPAKAVKSGIGQMPAYTSLSDEQIESIARYVAQATGAAG